tara:strand:+ start:384 stop:623 length:240 start_codon:yes stop_codon:yes gene_type:complete
MQKNKLKLDWNYYKDWSLKNTKAKSKIMCHKREILTSHQLLGKTEPYYETELEMLRIKKYDYHSLSEDEKLIYNKNKNQ